MSRVYYLTQASDLRVPDQEPRESLLTRLRFLSLALFTVLFDRSESLL